MMTAFRDLASATESVGSSARDMFMGEAHFFEETVTPERIKHLLDNTETSVGSKTSNSEKTEGMKYLLAMMAKGRDVSEYYPDVVRNVIVKAVEVKKLVYNYLVHHADANATCRELALLAINSFQRDLSDPNQLIRGLALKVLCGIRVREIVQIQIMSVKKCASDSSPYVRKTAAHSVGKIFQLDMDTKSELVEIIDRLLSDKTTAVLSSAVAAFNEICPDNLTLLHPHYRKLCHLLADLDEWGQIQAMTLLSRYARTQFLNPEREVAGGAGVASKPKEAKAKGKGKKKDKKFYSDDDNSDEATSDESSEEEVEEPLLQDDHSLLLRVTLPLLRSRNSGVVLGVAALHHYIGPRDMAVMGRIGRALVRVMRGHREVQYIVLTNIVEFAKQTPSMFKKYLKDFYIAESEPAFVRRMKLEVLAALASGDTAALVLREFGRYVKDDDKEFVKASIQCIVRIANSVPELTDRCLRGLMALVGTDCDTVVAEAVVSIRQLLQQNPQHDTIIVRLARKLPTTTSPSARAAMVWIMGEFQSKAKVAAMAPDALRQLAKNFKNEASEVKYQILNLAAKTALCQPDSKTVQLLLQYVLELARYDLDYDLRDRARLLRALLLSGDVSAPMAADALEEAGAVIAVGAGTAAGVAGFVEELASPPPVSAAAATTTSTSGGSEAGSGASASAEGDATSGGEGSGALASSATSTSALSGAGATAAAGGTLLLSPPPAPAMSMQERVKAVLLATKPPPVIESALAAGGAPSFMLGSLSFMVGHCARGYHALPDWAHEESSPSVREPPKDEDDDIPRRKKANKYAAKASSDLDSTEDESAEDDSEEATTEDESEEEEESDTGSFKPKATGGKKIVAGEDSEEEDEDESEAAATTEEEESEEESD